MQIVAQMKLVETKLCRHGTFSYMPDDAYVGTSLKVLGEFSEEEVKALQKMLRPGDVVIEVGANIGTLTIPMAKAVGLTGKVYAFEPYPINAALLHDNVEQNDLENVIVCEVALSDTNGRNRVPHLNELGHTNYGRIELGVGSLEVVCHTLDTYTDYGKVKLIKIDAEGHELQVIRGAAETIKRDRPIIYVENDRPEKGADLVSALVDLGYRMYWHRPLLWSEQNFAGSKVNPFGATISINMVCVHEDSGIEVKNLDEVADLRIGNNMYQREFDRYARTLIRNADDLESRLMMAHYSNLMQNCDQAEALLRENLRRNPDHTGSRAILGLQQLQKGNWAEGWPAYELRYKQKTTEGFGNRPHEGKPWDGHPTEEPVLIWCEQGFGDSIMFVRLWSMAKALAPNAFLEVQPQLYELFETSGIAPGCLYRMRRTMPDYAMHCSLPSLPATMRLRSNSSLRSSPYLKADPAMVQSWASRNTPRIGFCWEGSPRSERAYSRNIDPDLFRGITGKYGSFLSLLNNGQFESFADTAAAIKALDLVITVDTSVAHLSGALGVPTWLLLSTDPDWRWGLQGSKTVWYDRMRIFRQTTFMDWSTVVADVDAELAKWVTNSEAA